MKIVLVCAMLLGALTGCSSRSWLPYAREMGDTALLRTMGLDGGGERIELTVSTGGRATGQEALVLSAFGDSIPAAVLAVQSLGDSYVYYGHVDQLLLGEETAVLGVDPVVDYLAREAELGLGVQVWAVRGGTAGQAIRTAGGKGVPERLAQLNTDSELGAANIGRSAAELMTVLARGGSTYLPALELLNAREGDGGEGGEQTLVPNGYAILRQGKLVCWVDDDTARGIELMEEQTFGQVADLTLADGAKVSLTVEEVRTGCRPVFRGEELVGLDVTCTLSARVAQTGRRLNESDLQQLQQNLERMEGERMVQALELGQYWDADYLGLERRVQMARPDRKQAVQEQWEESFRSLDIRVEVRGTVERSFGMMGAGR